MGGGRVKGQIWVCYTKREIKSNIANSVGKSGGRGLIVDGRDP